MDKNIKQLWEEITYKREEKLLDRLSKFAEMILSVKQSDLSEKDKGQIILKLIRISSETSPYRNTADVISCDALNEIQEDYKSSAKDYVVPRQYKKNYRHEHVVPCKYLKEHIMAENVDEDRVKNILLKNGIRAIITRSQDGKLPITKMPDGWKLGDNPFQRYVDSGIISLEIKPDYVRP